MRTRLTHATLFGTVLLLGTIVSQPALAGHGRYAEADYGFNYVRHHDRHYNRHYRRSHRHHRRHHRSHRRDRAAYLAGGLVLGSIISHALHRKHERVTRRSHRGRGHVEQAPGRRLLRDLDGNCYERDYNRRGDEILVALPANACNW